MKRWKAREIGSVFVNDIVNHERRQELLHADFIVMLAISDSRLGSVVEN